MGLNFFNLLYISINKLRTIYFWMLWLKACVWHQGHKLGSLFSLIQTSVWFLSFLFFLSSFSPFLLHFFPFILFSEMKLIFNYKHKSWRRDPTGDVFTNGCENQNQREAGKEEDGKDKYIWKQLTEKQIKNAFWVKTKQTNKRGSPLKNITSNLLSAFIESASPDLGNCL